MVSRASCLLAGLLAVLAASAAGAQVPAPPPRPYKPPSDADLQKSERLGSVTQSRLIRQRSSPDFSVLIRCHGARVTPPLPHRAARQLLTRRRCSCLCSLPALAAA